MKSVEAPPALVLTDVERAFCHLPAGCGWGAALASGHRMRSFLDLSVGDRGCQGVRDGHVNK